MPARSRSSQPLQSKPHLPVWLLVLGAATGAAALLYVGKRRRQAASQNEEPQGKETTQETPEQAASERPGRLSTAQPGDILLFHNARGLNKLITLFTRSPFYHAALYAGGSGTVEARTSGVVRGDLRDRIDDFVVAPAPEGKGAAALAWAETQIGDAYDNFDIAVIILDRLCRFLHYNYTPSDKFSCGEFIAVAFDKAGASLFPKRDLGAVVPADFAPIVPRAEQKRAR